VTWHELYGIGDIKLICPKRRSYTCKDGSGNLGSDAASLGDSFLTFRTLRRRQNVTSESN
jgi:hypothetical protein